MFSLSTKSMMAKSCLIAAIYASMRRNAKPVSAFTTNRLSSQSHRVTSVAFTNHVDTLFNWNTFGNENGHTSVTRLMSSTASSTDTKIIKRVKTIDATPSDEIVAIKGWVRTVRKQKTLAFVEVNDGSSLSGIQCVLPFDEIDEASNAGKDSFHIFS